MTPRTWLDDLRHDPLEPLLLSGHPAIEYWTRRDLLEEAQPDREAVLWRLPVPSRILGRQRADGSWAYPGATPRSSTDYSLLETYRELGFLVDMFGLTRGHPAIVRAAEYVLSHQSPEGDIRGIYGGQYSPNYTAALIELLVKAGYENDHRISSAFTWLDGSQQEGGGWALALRTRGRALDALNDPDTIQPVRSRPFSHLVTGVVLRAYASHPAHRRSETARAACALLAGRFFQKDAYADKNKAADWTKFSFPFWMTDIVSSLDSISLISPELRGEKIDRAKTWLIDHQEPSGLFTGHLLRDRYHDLQLWLSLAVCRIFARMGAP